jgi:hypothetical protein
MFDDIMPRSAKRGRERMDDMLRPAKRRRVDMASDGPPPALSASLASSASHASSLFPASSAAATSSEHTCVTAGSGGVTLPRLSLPLARAESREDRGSATNIRPSVQGLTVVEIRQILQALRATFARDGYVDQTKIVTGTTTVGRFCFAYQQGKAIKREEKGQKVV